MNREEELTLQEVMISERKEAGREAYDQLSELAYSTRMSKWNPGEGTKGHRLLVQDLWDHCRIIYHLTGRASIALKYFCHISGGQFIDYSSEDHGTDLISTFMELAGEAGHLAYRLQDAVSPDSEDGEDISLNEARVISECATEIENRAASIRLNAQRLASKEISDPYRRGDQPQGSISAASPQSSRS